MSTPVLRSRWLTLLGLALLSLCVRVVTATVLDVWQAAPAFDEIGYVARAQGAHEALFGDGGQAAWRRWYGKGRWPPLHPLLLTAGVPFGLPGMRLMAIALGALGTVAVAEWGRLLAGPRAGLFTGIAHAMLPAWVFYGVSLWSETTFLVLGSSVLVLAMRTFTEPERRWPLWGGLTLGLALCTRATALPWLVLLPGLLWVRGQRRDAVTWLGATGMVWVPWLVVLYLDQGRLLPGSTLGGYNAWLGAMPGAPMENGGAWGLTSHKALAHEAMRVQPALQLAAQAWWDAPMEQLSRAWFRVLLLLTPDFFAARHLTGGHWPAPVGRVAALASLSLVLTAWLPATALAGMGAHRDRAARWLVLLALAPALPALFTVGIPRLALPSLTWLLPLAFTARWSWQRAVLAVALLFGSLLPLQHVLPRHVRPTAALRPALLEAWPKDWVGPSLDRVELRRTEPDGELTLTVDRGTVHRPGTRPGSEVIWPALMTQLEVELTDQAPAPVLNLGTSQVVLQCDSAWHATDVAGVETRCR